MRSLIKKILNEQTENKSNFHSLMEKFKESFPPEYKKNVDEISTIIKNYIVDHGFQIKFLNSCNTGFMGVRTNKFIIICSPHNMEKIGDFIYTIFHEIRHEEQMSKDVLNLPNPLTGDLSDFEDLFKNYWNLELDADSFAKKKIAEIVVGLNLPIELSKKHFSLSPYVQNYPSLSNMIKGHIQSLVSEIKMMKDQGMDFKDIADHPFVKKHLDYLEDFI